MEWTPTKISQETGCLEINQDYPIDTVTTVHCSEGDTLFISQNTYDNGDIQHVAIDRHELYDIIYNYVSVKELQVIIAEKQQ